MELYQLRTFAAVAEEAHLTHAAERLHISQPAVSAHIKALESELDTRLFERVASGMQLTPAGQELLARAREVLAAADALRRAALALKGEVVGMLRVGSVSDPQGNRLGELLACTVRRHPKLKLELHQSVSGAALEAVRAGEFDASFYFGDAPGPGFVSLPLMQIVYRVAVPAAWREQMRGMGAAAGLAALSALPWVRTPAISTHSKLVAQLFSSHGVQLPQQQIEADNESVIVNLVVSGVGASLVREDVARPRERAGELLLWPHEKLRTTLWFVVAAERADEPLPRALLGCVREVWGRAAAAAVPAAPARATAGD